MFLKFFDYLNLLKFKITFIFIVKGSVFPLNLRFLIKKFIFFDFL